MIATLIPTENTTSGAEVDPWLDRLFERRQSVQITLHELERQISGGRAHDDER